MNKNIYSHSYHLFNIYLDKRRQNKQRSSYIKAHRMKIGIGIHYRAIPEHSIYKKLFKWKINDYPNAKKLEDKLGYHYLHP